jgi:tRNA(Met) C34 N-acetyltransferase TmcA
MQIDSYEGADRGFILRFQNAGTVERETRYGSRGSLRARHWFGISSAFQMDAAASRVAEEIENLLQQEFQQM